MRKGGEALVFGMPVPGLLLLLLLLLLEAALLEPEPGAVLAAFFRVRAAAGGVV